MSSDFNLSPNITQYASSDIGICVRKKELVSEFEKSFFVEFPHNLKHSA